MYSREVNKGVHQIEDLFDGAFLLFLKALKKWNQEYIGE